MALRAAATSEVFRAIADPTRRAILHRLAGGPQSVTELGEPFPITQPAMSQHLRVLRDAGLVAPRRDGRRRLYELNAKPLRAVAEWVEHYEKFWQQKLGKLGEYLDRNP